MRIFKSYSFSQAVRHFICHSIAQPVNIGINNWISIGVWKNPKDNHKSPTGLSFLRMIQT